MPANRIIYNVQNLFVAPYSGEYKDSSYDFYLNGYKILKRIDRLQSFNYNINNNNFELGGFNSKKYIFRGLVGNPEITFDFSYVPDGVTNENRLNFDVGHISGNYIGQMFSGLTKNDTLLNNRDFYLAINEGEGDVYTSGTRITSTVFAPTKIEDIIDPNSPKYSLLHFQNSTLNAYSFQINVGAVPTVTQKYIADNITLYASGSGVHYAILDLKSGVNIGQNEKILIPKNLDYYQTSLKGKNLLLPTEGVVSFYTTNKTGILFYNDNLQSLNFDLAFNRKPLKSINYKFPLYKKIDFPINGQLGLSMIIKDELSGSFFETINKEEDYNIVINFSSPRIDVYNTKYTFSGCKFDSIEYTSSIENNKIANLNFNFDLDPDFNNKGLIVSGNVIYGLLNNQQNKVLIF